MEFEFDENKSKINKEKHGLDFVESQELWSDMSKIEIPAKETGNEEVRSMVIGQINNKHWSAIITYRQNKVRIISVRRSRKDEVNLYESTRIR